MTDRRIGVFICHCGGNISDYVDVEAVREAVQDEQGVVIAKTTMFACSDAAQEEMIEHIRNDRLDGLVVASCSPKLHLFTFRAMAERARLNPYQYVQVNLREQCSWAHRDDLDSATRKAIMLVRAGIVNATLSRPLVPERIETIPQVLVIGAGVAGLKAAITLADMGLGVHVVERSAEAGGWTVQFGKMFLRNQEGSATISQLLADVKARENITLLTNAEVVEKRGSVGDFTTSIRVGDGERIELRVGAIIVATGFDTYTPAAEEFGYGREGVLTLPEFKALVDGASGPLVYHERPVRDIAYIYCVGSRQPADVEGGNSYCSHFCCNAAAHMSISASEIDEEINQFHLYRDIRTYGKYELLFEEARRRGAVFVKFDDESPPVVEKNGDALRVSVKDMLMSGEEIELRADLVVLVTGMVPRENAALTDVLKLPVGRDGFYNEIHPKLRPVETVVAGIFIAGASQSPKTLAESVASSLAAVSKSAGLLMKGFVELEPFVAEINTDRCTWCGECLTSCPYEAIEKTSQDGKDVARILSSLCKGGGACVPVCPENAIDLKGYTDSQVRAMIDMMAKEAV